jgi:hypothetical protein
LPAAEGWLIEEFSDAASANDFGDRLRLTGYLNDADLRALYSSCKLFVYPSLYEGFGLPPLEAMACGAPVIASRIPAHEETLNDNALLVDPLDELALSQAIIELLENESDRERLAKNGKRHVEKFAWHKTAELTFEVYEEVLRDSKKSEPHALSCAWFQPDARATHSNCSTTNGELTCFATTIKVSSCICSSDCLAPVSGSWVR